MHPFTRISFQYSISGIFLLVLLLLVSCGSTPTVEEEPVVDTTVATPLFVPEIQEQGFFAFSDKSIMQDMELGSPASIRRAAAKIRNPSSQSEKIILAVASSLMSIVWPSEQNGISIPTDIEANAYTGAIDSAKMGIYDVNTGNTDFFTMVLPSLVLLTSSSSQTDYYNQSQAALSAALELKPDSVLVQYLLGTLYQRMGDLNSSRRMYEQAAELAEEYDYVLLDCPAGIEQGFQNAIAGATRAIVVATPEVASIRDADRIIGLLEKNNIRNLDLILNRIRIEMVKRGDMMSVEDVTEILAVNLLGALPDDEQVVISTNQGESLVETNSLAGRAYRNISLRITGEKIPIELFQSISFWTRVSNIFHKV